MESLAAKYSELVPYPLKPHQTQKEDCPNCVYMIFNPVTNFTKIGITSNPYARLQTLQTQSGIELWLLMYVEMEIEYDEDAKSVEQFVHRHFKDKRKKGEWFDLNLRDILEIRGLFYRVYGLDMEDNTPEFWEQYKKITHGKKQQLHNVHR